MKKLIVALLSSFFLLHAEETGFNFYNGPLLFKPLVANTFEPRMGLIWHLSGNKLRLDIGNSVDLLQYKFVENSRLMTIGSDFFTYTFLRGETNFHFPVDAVDYLFGFNVNYKDTLDHGIFSTRLRLSHISAHFVDGHYENFTHLWKDNRLPHVYSREFFDLVAAYEPGSLIRLYLGGIYIWHIDPTSLSQFATYLGGELQYELSSVVNPYCSYQITFSGIRPRHELQTGLKIGRWNGRGLNLFFLFYAGNSIHGEYYDMKDNYSGIGFVIDF